MKQTRTLAFAALLAVVGLTVSGAGASAVPGDREAQQLVTQTQDVTDQTVTEAREAAKLRVEQAREAAKERAQAAREKATARLEARKLEITTKLDAARKERCEAREERINKIIGKAAEQSTKQLDVFRKIEDKVVAFYADKQLSADNYDALLTAANEKEAAVQVAIESTEVILLDCEAEGAARELGTLARSSVKTLHEALKEYRTAIKDLIVGVKQANDAANAEDSAADADTAENTEEAVTTPTEVEGQ